MIFLDKYDQCNNCRLNNMCTYKEDYYKNKGGDYREVLKTDDQGNCQHAPFKRSQSGDYGKVDC